MRVTLFAFVLCWCIGVVALASTSIEDSKQSSDAARSFVEEDVDATFNLASKPAVGRSSIRGQNRIESVIDSHAAAAERVLRGSRTRSRNKRDSSSNSNDGSMGYGSMGYGTKGYGTKGHGTKGGGTKGGGSSRMSPSEWYSWRWDFARPSKSKAGSKQMHGPGPRPTTKKPLTVSSKPKPSTKPTRAPVPTASPKETFVQSVPSNVIPMFVPPGDTTTKPTTVSSTPAPIANPTRTPTASPTNLPEVPSASPADAPAAPFAPSQPVASTVPSFLVPQGDTATNLTTVSSTPAPIVNPTSAPVGSPTNLPEVPNLTTVSSTPAPIVNPTSAPVGSPTNQPEVPSASPADAPAAPFAPSQHVASIATSIVAPPGTIAAPPLQETPAP